MKISYDISTLYHMKKVSTKQSVPKKIVTSPSVTDENPQKKPSAKKGVEPAVKKVVKPSAKKGVEPSVKKVVKKSGTKSIKKVSPTLSIQVSSDWPSRLTIADIHAMLKQTAHTSWTPLITEELEKPYWADIADFLNAELASGKIIYPAFENIFAALQWCTFTDCKVIIIGQDPYINAHQAHGLCFSVMPHPDLPAKDRIPPSLRNIYKRLAENIPEFSVPNHACLTDWAKQGILLLNSCLTVEGGKAGAHLGKAGWEAFTQNLLQYIARNKRDLVFLCWGRPALNTLTRISTSAHYVLSCSHPSPLGYNSTDKPFATMDHFKRTNDIMVRHGKTPINWQLADSV